MSNRNTNTKPNLPINPENLMSFTSLLTAPHNSDVECEYMNDVWRGIQTFAQTMIDINKKYLKTSRKRKAPSSDSDSDAMSTPPPRKKQKTSHSSSKSKSKKKSSKSKKSPSKSQKKAPKSPKKAPKSPKSKSPKRVTKPIKKKTKKSAKSPKVKSPKKPTKNAPKRAAKTKRAIPSKTKEGEARIYKLRFPRSAWVFYNTQKIAQLLDTHPDAGIGERTKMSAKVWNTLDEDERDQWEEMAAAEQLQYEECQKLLEKNGTFDEIPSSWKRVNRKAERGKVTTKHKKGKKGDAKTKKPTKKKDKKKKKKKKKEG
eukprot:589251_1